MYPDKNGLTTNCRSDRDVGLRKDIDCITDIYARQGYNVSYFGKCHWERTEPLFDEEGNYVGSLEDPGGNYVNRYDTYVPPGASRHGIDYFFQALKDEHFNPRIYSSDPQAIEGKKDGELYLPKRFSSELESEMIMDYLANTHQQRDSDKPFFMMWSLNPPHNPWTEQSTYMDFFHLYEDEGKIDIQNLLTHENADTTVGAYAPYYFTNVSAVDHFIGKVLTQLERLGLDKNTIVVFSSDHGEMLGSHGLRGKNVPEIESYSIPFIIRWGDKLTHRVEDLILSVPDIMPTLLGMSNMEHLIPDEVQGKNHSSILMDQETATEKPQEALFINPNSRGIYTGKYMFVVREKDGNMERAFAYDNENDPAQMHQIAADELPTELLSMFKADLYKLLEETEDSWFTNGVCAEFFDE
jgi:arylsulfatase A-like enzyme